MFTAGHYLSLAKMNMERRTLTYAMLLVPLVLVVLLVYRQVVLSQIPIAEKRIPVRIAPDEIPIPKRPGTQSIRIVGPPLKKIKFELDFKRNPLALDWHFLEQTDKRADIMVDGVIDEVGILTIKRVRDGGHPKAGSYVRQVVSSWRFLPYKMGSIRYYFNVPTRMENMKVQVDVSRLIRNPSHLSNRVFLKDGVLCHVEGLARDNIMIIR